MFFIDCKLIIKTLRSSYNRLRSFYILCILTYLISYVNKVCVTYFTMKKLDPDPR